MNNPYKYANPSGNVAQAFTEDGKKIVVDPEKKKQTIQDEVADQQADLVLNNRSQAPFYDDLGALERELEQKTKDSITTSDQGFIENTINFQNPYNNQLNISGNKENNSKKGYNENTFIKDGLNFIDESLSVIGDVLKSVSTIKLVISTNAIVFKAVELLCLTFTGGFALISGVTESPLIITLLPFGTICSVILMVDSKIQEYTSYTGETPGGDELSEVEVEKRRTEGLNNSNTAFSLFMLGMTGIHINNAIDTSIMTVLTDKYGNLILSNAGVIK